jgi:hypothetical protein
MADWIASVLQWFIEFFQSFFYWWYETTLNITAFFIEMIPVPDFLATMPTYTLPPVVLWILAPFELAFGLSIISGAIIARFVLKLTFFRR